MLAPRRTGIYSEIYHSVIEKIKYLDYGKGVNPRKPLFHENWQVDYGKTSPRYRIPDPFTYLTRLGTYLLRSNLVSLFGNITQYARSYYGEIEALPLEVVGSGSLSYLLSGTPGSNSAYTMPYNDITSQFTDEPGLGESWFVKSIAPEIIARDFVDKTYTKSARSESVNMPTTKEY